MHDVHPFLNWAADCHWQRDRQRGMLEIIQRRFKRVITKNAALQRGIFVVEAIAILGYLALYPRPSTQAVIAR
jgi:hypothetical protein